MTNRVVAITGENSAIGLAISETFLENDRKVAIFAQSLGSGAASFIIGVNLQVDGGLAQI